MSPFVLGTYSSVNPVFLGSHKVQTGFNSKNLLLPFLRLLRANSDIPKASVHTAYSYYTYPKHDDPQETVVL